MTLTIDCVTTSIVTKIRFRKKNHFWVNFNAFGEIFHEKTTRSIVMRKPYNAFSFNLQFNIVY